MPYQKGNRSVLPWESHHWVHNHKQTQYSSSRRIQETQQGVQWSQIPKASPVYHMGPCHRATVRSTQHPTRKTTPPHSRREKWDAQVHTGASQKGNNLHIQITLCSQHLLCKEEGQKTITSTGLQNHKQMDKKEQECIPPHSPSHWSPQQVHQVHHYGHPLGI